MSFLVNQGIKPQKQQFVGVSVTHRCRGFLDEICGAASSAVLSKFWLRAQFEPTWCTSYSEFDISFENFQKKRNGSKLSKRCLLRISIQNFFQIWKIFFKNGQKYV
jgi:hypothetical protein